MTQEHPITPPPELVKQWVSLACEYEGDETWIDLATEAARWGADQELEACCEWLRHEDLGGCGLTADWLYEARRSKPPSLKAQSIALIDKIQGNKEMWDIRDLDVIRRALESLPE